MDDLALLKAYLDRKDQEAFAHLVRRHTPWLYSAARRQLGDGQLAEDATQAVFLLLSQRANTLQRYRYLTGWLFLALSYCIGDIKAQRSRQQRREQEAAAMRPENVKPEIEWEAIAPMLEAAVGQLGRKDRDAVLLRFYEQRPLAEVGALLGISEEAARKRVDRALDRLREHLAAKGIEAQTLSLSSLILTHATEGSPAGLVGTIITGVAQGTGSSTAGRIAQGAGKMMVMAKVKVAAATVLILGGLALAGSATWPATMPATAATSRSPAGEFPSASRTMEQYRRNQSAFDRCVIRSRSHMTFVNSGSGETLMETREAMEYRYDGRRLDVNLTTGFVHLGREAPPPSQTMRRIWDGSTWSVVTTVNGPTPLVDALLLRDEKQKSDYIAGGPEAPLRGFLPSDRQTWDTILQGAASVEVKSEGELYLLEASTSHGRYRVWVDPQKGYTVQKAHVHKGENDIAYGRPMKEHRINRNAGLKSSFDAPDGMKGIDISLAVARTERIGNAWVPMEATWTVKTTYADGTVQTDTQDLVREHVDLAPDFEAMRGAFVPDIPEGSRVFVAWAPNVRYLWRKGEPVPEADRR